MWVHVKRKVCSNKRKPFGWVNFSRSRGLLSPKELNLCVSELKSALTRQTYSSYFFLLLFAFISMRVVSVPEELSFVLLANPVGSLILFK